MQRRTEEERKAFVLVGFNEYRFEILPTSLWVIGLIFFSKDIWEDIRGYLRVTVDFQVSGVLLLGRSGVAIPGWFRWTWLGMGLIVYLWVCFRI